jgi:hypothetical protein
LLGYSRPESVDRSQREVREGNPFRWERTNTNMAPTAKRSAAPKSPPKYRSADTGKYVKPGYAKTHPKTTVKETDRKRK